MSDLVPLLELTDQPLSVFPGGLDSDVIAMDRSADSPRLFGEKARARMFPAQANLLQEASMLAFPSFEQRLQYKLSQQSTLPTAWCLPPPPSGSSM